MVIKRKRVGRKRKRLREIGIKRKKRYGTKRELEIEETGAKKQN